MSGQITVLPERFGICERKTPRRRERCLEPGAWRVHVHDGKEEWEWRVCKGHVMEIVGRSLREVE